MGFETLSLAATAGNSIMGAMASQQSGAYQAQVARNNQVIANYNAQLEEQKGVQQEQVSRQRTAQTIGSERAAYGAGNIDVNSGSAERTQEDTARLGEMDAETIRQNAARSAWNYRSQAASYGADAQMAQRAGNMGAFASLIGGAGQFADKWSRYKSQGW